MSELFSGHSCFLYSYLSTSGCGGRTTLAHCCIAEHRACHTFFWAISEMQPDRGTPLLGILQGYLITYKIMSEMFVGHTHKTFHFLVAVFCLSLLLAVSSVVGTLQGARPSKLPAHPWRPYALWLLFTLAHIFPSLWNALLSLGHLPYSCSSGTYFIQEAFPATPRISLTSPHPSCPTGLDLYSSFSTCLTTCQYCLCIPLILDYVSVSCIVPDKEKNHLLI